MGLTSEQAKVMGHSAEDQSGRGAADHLLVRRRQEGGAGRGGASVPGLRTRHYCQPPDPQEGADRRHSQEADGAVRGPDDCP